MISGKNTTFPTLRVIAFPISSLIETLASLLHHYYRTIKKRKQIKLYVSTQCREKQKTNRNKTKHLLRRTYWTSNAPIERNNSLLRDNKNNNNNNNIRSNATTTITIQNTTINRKLNKCKCRARTNSKVDRKAERQTNIRSYRCRRHKIIIMRFELVARL